MKTQFMRKKKESTPPEVSICIVNHNTRDLLYKCIKSIKEKSSGVDYEIIVVDNGSRDESIEMMRSEWPDCKLVKTSNNGFAKGCNIGINESRAKYVMFLNPDTELVTNALKGMTSFMERNSEYAAVGCRLISRNGDIQFECARSFPTIFNEICYLIILLKTLRKNRLLSSSEMEFWDHQNSRNVDCLSGACMMVRKKVLDELNGFDEYTFMYSEDVDLCYRMMRAGWKRYYLSEEVIIHDQAASSNKKGIEFTVLMKQESKYHFFMKHFGNQRARGFRFVVFIGSLFRVIVLILISSLIIVYTGDASDVRRRINKVMDKYLTVFFWAIGWRSFNLDEDSLG